MLPKEKPLLASPKGRKIKKIVATMEKEKCGIRRYEISNITSKILNVNGRYSNARW